MKKKKRMDWVSLNTSTNDCRFQFDQVGSNQLTGTSPDLVNCLNLIYWICLSKLQGAQM